MSTFIRPPAVAGQFYPGKRETLLRDLSSYTRVEGEKIRAIGCVVPHAGYMYSGHVAGAVYGRLELPARFIILCPNHTGYGEPLAIVPEGCYQTPLGEVPIDSELARELMSRDPLLSEDYDAQRHEHALEVQLPFLQSLLSSFTFAPITVAVTRWEYLEQLGVAMAEAVAARKDRVMIIASSDMNHYETDSSTRVKDRLAIDRVLALDARGLYEEVINHQISMCGFGPATAMLTAAKRLGAKKAELVKYATSGDISGDRKRVVGYAGIAVS
ncbi:MAG TPA: AmmeMemoRadiSam system protein B [Terriglobales bacterium]|nr:AmmeMemoRadiSam system protein B [Terriglobales bacterium]